MRQKQHEMSSKTIAHVTEYGEKSTHIHADERRYLRVEARIAQNDCVIHKSVVYKSIQHTHTLTGVHLFGLFARVWGIFSFQYIQPSRSIMLHLCLIGFGPCLVYVDLFEALNMC